jgi:hypothetical protein
VSVLQHARPTDTTTLPKIRADHGRRESVNVSDRRSCPRDRRRSVLAVGGFVRRASSGVRQLLLVSFLYLVYSASRSLASHDVVEAKTHASHVLAVEKWLHVDVEAYLNHAVTGAVPLAVVASYWYATLHYLVTPVVLALLFKKDRLRYFRARNALLVATILGLGAYLLFPTAPPRLMGSEYHDTLAAVSHYGWWTTHASAPAGLGGMTNELAAMPSLHVGWAAWVAWVAHGASQRAWRSVGVVYAVGTGLVVVATGNHWVLDAFAGVVVVACGICASNPIRARRSEDLAHRTRRAVARAIVGSPRSSHTAPLPSCAQPYCPPNVALAASVAKAGEESVSDLVAHSRPGDRAHPRDKRHRELMEPRHLCPELVAD